MASEEEKSGRQEVCRLLNRINDAWLKGRPEDISGALEGCFHEDVVVCTTSFQELARGRAACAQIYEDFVRQATVRECRLSEPDIHVWGDSAVALYAWEMTYRMNDQDYQESGRDLFVLARAEGRWQAVWRAALPAAQH